MGLKITLNNTIIISEFDNEIKILPSDDFIGGDRADSLHAYVYRG